MFVDYFTTSPYAPPELLFRTFSKFGYWINNKTTEHEYSSMGVHDNQLLANLSAHKLLVSSSKCYSNFLFWKFNSFGDFLFVDHYSFSDMIFDINRQQIFPINTGLKFNKVQYNPFNNMIVAHAHRKIYVMDKDFNTVAESGAIEPHQASVRVHLDIVDEYTVLSTHPGGATVMDLRTMRPLLKISTKVLRCFFNFVPAVEHRRD